MRISFSLCAAVVILLAACQSQTEPVQKTKRKKTSVVDIEAGIRDHIAEVTAETGGFFPISYEEDTLYLKLVRVHTDYLSNLGPNKHFACVDLADESGDVYDVDFFLSGKPGEMTVTRKSVHKENGKPFYTWKQQKDKTWKQIPVEASENRLMGVVEGEDAFDFHYEVTLPTIEGDAAIWIPVAQSDPWQQIELLSTTPENRGSFEKEDEYGNQYLYFALDESDSEKTIRLDYAVKRIEKGPYAEDGLNPNRYLRSTELLPVGGRFESIVNDVIDRDDSDLMQARAIYDFIVDTVRYRKAGQYGTGDANYACDSRSGNCTEFHSYFISLAKSAGIPARFAIGAAIPSERNEGGVNGYHCWAEFYADGKWWPIDISEGNKYAALSTYYFGHHPANRIEFSRGRDLRLTPLPVSGTVPFFAYPVFEEDGITKKVKTRFTFEREAS
jgi:transglutaminase-like putative cysteine protease